jgi:hypothetical protein
VSHGRLDFGANNQVDTNCPYCPPHPPIFTHRPRETSMASQIADMAPRSSLLHFLRYLMAVVHNSHPPHSPKPPLSVLISEAASAPISQAIMSASISMVFADGALLAYTAAGFAIILHIS